MATKICNVNIPNGWFMSWFVTTQTSNMVTVKLADSKKTYFEESRQSTNIDPPLNTGYEFVEGNDIKLTVTVPVAPELKGEPHTNDILTTNGIIVGKEFTMCLEDWIDNDYNDIAISITAWKTRG